jgi:hypothetical protein
MHEFMQNLTVSIFIVALIGPIKNTPRESGLVCFCRGLDSQGSTLMRENEFMQKSTASIFIVSLIEPIKNTPRESGLVCFCRGLRLPREQDLDLAYAGSRASDRVLSEIYLHTS